jgi:peptidoglycan hydrolase-like protein with peptidoglycan-binding domain
VLAQFDPALTQLSIDGVFGPRTREAVENFQQSQGLPVTGTADETTWQRLYQAYAGVDDLLLRDTVLFPVELADSQSREVRQAMPEADYSQSTRRGQYPGQEQGLNSTDEGG